MYNCFHISITVSLKQLYLSSYIIRNEPDLSLIHLTVHRLLKHFMHKLIFFQKLAFHSWSNFFQAFIKSLNESHFLEHLLTNNDFKPKTWTEIVFLSFFFSLSKFKAIDFPCVVFLFILKQTIMLVPQKWTQAVPQWIFDKSLAVQRGDHTPVQPCKNKTYNCLTWTVTRDILCCSLCLWFI